MAKFGTVFIPNHIKIQMQAYLANKMATLWKFLEFDVSGGLNREGAYLKFWLRGEGPIRERGA